MFQSIGVIFQGIIQTPLGGVNTPFLIRHPPKVFCNNTPLWGSSTDAGAAGLSIEGPCMPDVREGTPEQEAKLNVLIEGAVNEWNKAPRRRVV